MTGRSRRQEGSPFDQVVELIGEAGGDALQAKLAGRRLYIPRSAGPSHPLTVAIGADLAARLGERFGGEHLDIPLSVGRRVRIVTLKRAGRSVSEIMAEVGVCRRTVFYALANAEGEPSSHQDDQLTLL